LKDVYVHAFTDGRDVDPKSGKIHSGSRKLYQNTSVQLASIIGRYYAMDRDKRWERIKLAYDLLVNGQGTHSRNAVATMEESYANNVTDEFIDPITIIDSNDKPMATEEGDVVIFFNFRTDRGRELTEVLNGLA
jgi:2,3-bisphosphoglycerate-independent phosphoglycerate mutase